MPCLLGCGGGEEVIRQALTPQAVPRAYRSGVLAKGDSSNYLESLCLKAVFDRRSIGYSQKSSVSR
jgi:hypothetical protein